MSTLKVNALQDTSGKGLYPARAWLNFNGSGTLAIRDDEGVSSVTDNNTANYTVNWSNSFSNANYAPAGVMNNVGYGGESWQIMTTSAVPTSSALRVHTTRSGLGIDASYCTVIASGDM